MVDLYCDLHAQIASHLINQAGLCRHTSIFFLHLYARVYSPNSSGLNTLRIISYTKPTHLMPRLNAWPGVET